VGRAHGAHLHFAGLEDFYEPTARWHRPPYSTNRRTSPIPDASDLTEQKTSFRKAAQARRRDLVAGLDAAGCAEALAGHVGRALADRAPGTVTGYLAIGDEIDPAPALARLAREGWTVALPVVLGRGLALEFRAWEPGDALEGGPLGTRHPAAGAALRPDVLLVPMLAFDGAAMRMGWGGGFYDRTIAGLRAGGDLVAMGIAFFGQAVDTVPAGPHDAPLDAVATEAGVTWFEPED